MVWETGNMLYQNKNKTKICLPKITIDTERNKEGVLRGCNSP